MKVVRVEPVFEPVQCSFGASALELVLPSHRCSSWGALRRAARLPGCTVSTLLAVGGFTLWVNLRSDRQPWPSCLTSATWAQGQEITREEISPETACVSS